MSYPFAHGWNEGDLDAEHRHLGWGEADDDRPSDAELADDEGLRRPLGRAMMDPTERLRFDAQALGLDPIAAATMEYSALMDWINANGGDVPF